MGHKFSQAATTERVSTIPNLRQRGKLTRGRHRRRDGGRVLSEHDRKPGLQMEVDVAVQEPRPRVVRREPDRDVVAHRPRAHHVALRRVHVVVRRLPRPAHDVERVPVQVEGVRRARGPGRRDGERQLDRRVRRERVHAPAREQVRRRGRAGEDLEQDGDVRWDEGRAVHEELRPVEREGEVERVVDAAGHSGAGRSEVRERDEARLRERVAAASLRRRRLDIVRAGIAEDGRVHTAGERSRTDVRERANPVVVHGLVSRQDERVPLAGEDLDLVNREGSVADSVHLDDVQVVAVDGEREVGIARHRDKAETVALALRNVDHGESTGVTPSEAAESVDQDRVRTRTTQNCEYQR